MVTIKIKKYLEKNNKSIYWLSERTDLTYTTLYRIVNQRTDGIQFHTLEEIMKALNITDFNKIFEIVPEERE